VGWENERRIEGEGEEHATTKLTVPVRLFLF